MDLRESAWFQLQCRRAAKAAGELIFHRIAPQYRGPAQAEMVRLVRAEKEALDRFNDANELDGEAPAEPELPTCDYGDSRGCGGTEVFAPGVLKDVGGSLVCPRCLALSEEDAEPKPRSYYDEGLP